MSARHRHAARERLQQEARQERIRRAAPALLEALEMVRDADDDCHRDDLPWLPPAARSAIDAAIAAARGES